MQIMRGESQAWSHIREEAIRPCLATPYIIPYLRAVSRLVYACFCFSLSSFFPAKILVGPAGGFIDIGIVIPFRSGVPPLPYRPPTFRTWFRLKLLLRPGIGGLPLLTGDYPPPVDVSFSVFLF